MNKFTALLLVFAFLIALIPNFFTTQPKVFASHSSVNLLTTADFAVLAGSAISNTPTSVIIGNVGLSPAAGSFITGLTCAEITGTLYDVDGAYAGGGGGSTACRITNAGLLTTAKNDLTTAYNDAAGRTTTSQVGTELGGTTLTDGTYDSASGTFGITGTLTLNAQGNSDAIFIFKMASTLTTASSSRVVLANGAQACNVYWQVGSSAVLGTSTTLVGNVLALTSITDNGGSTVNGRLLARNAAVTLNNTTITRQACAAATSSSSSSSSSGSSLPVCPTISTTLIAPRITESRRVNANSVFISWGPYSGTDKFIVQYGLEKDKWIYSTDVTGFSTALNSLPSNQPIWVRVGLRNDCSVGVFGASIFTGAPRLPSAGLGHDKNNLPWHLPTATLVATGTAFVFIQRRYKHSSAS